MIETEAVAEQTEGENMRLCNLSHTTLLAVLMGSSVVGATFSVAARAADVATDQSTSAATGQHPVPPAIVTTGPVYAFGPVLQTTKPRAPRQNWSDQPNGANRNAGRNYGMLQPAPYRRYQGPATTRPWQPYPPRGNWNSPGMNNPNQYGYQSHYRRPHTSDARDWFDPPYRQNGEHARYRQQYWRY